MPPNPARKEESRRRVLAAASRLFRQHGYAGVGIDTIMAAAGLTRGAFYAHFPSKRALFAEVIGGEHGFNRLMKGRGGGDPDTLTAEALAIVGGYLHPDHRAEVGLGCTMAALAADVARGGAEARAAYARRVRELAGEFARGLPDRDGGPEPDPRAPDPRALAAMVLSVGAMVMVRALDDDALAAAILTACRDEAERVLTEEAP
ncbi:MAG: TetR/AcrR family transcriptional regulator [Hyphomicrobiales bacterium]|nr:TetR/AcrR family transcriptional regulator [Hyphomicrobiales bacterium]MCP5370648.1 TetR/AcrR family transcriptional regulator [Hyphomicrobiales bacterium]